MCCPGCAPTKGGCLPPSLPESPIKSSERGSEDTLIWKGLANPNPALPPRVVGGFWGPNASSPAQPPASGSICLLFCMQSDMKSWAALIQAMQGGIL